MQRSQNHSTFILSALAILSLIHETGVFKNERIEHCNTYIESCFHHEQVIEMDFADDYYTIIYTEYIASYQPK